MADKKYKCENGHEFSLDEFDDRKCPNPNCDSERIESINNNPFDKLIDFFKNNKIIGLGIGGLVVLILILNLYDSCNKKPITTTYKVNISDYDPNIKGFVFDIIKTTTKDGVPKFDTVSFIDIEASFNFTVNGDPLSPSKFGGPKNNIYYPCKEGLYSFTWIYPTSYPNKNLATKNESKPSCEVTFADQLPSGNAECAATIKITNAYIEGCELVIATNFDTIKTKHILISIHGKNGPFEKRNRWNVEKENLKKFVIYYAIEEGTTDTAEFVEKNNQDINVNCKVLTQADIAQIKATFIAAAMAYGNAPDNRTLQAAFNDLLQSSANIKVKLNGKNLNGESELYVELKKAYNDDGTKFKLVPSSLVISNKGTIESFEFKTN